MCLDNISVKEDIVMLCGNRMFREYDALFLSGRRKLRLECDAVQPMKDTSFESGVFQASSSIVSSLALSRVLPGRRTGRME